MTAIEEREKIKLWGLKMELVVMMMMMMMIIEYIGEGAQLTRLFHVGQ
jgi:hypothetical protein